MIKERLLDLEEYLRKYEIPSYEVKAGDLAVIMSAGHCGASTCCGIWFVPAEKEPVVREMVEEYMHFYDTEPYCPHCGLSESLQWKRYIVEIITSSLLEQASELEISIEELLEHLHTI